MEIASDNVLLSQLFFFLIYR